MARRANIFYGYPSQPAFIGESIANAVEQLAGHSTIKQNHVRFRPWPTIRASGKLLARTIMESIDRAQIFACDLTYPNDNVSFELGYAIGRFKRIFVSLDSGIEGSGHRFNRHYYNSFSLGYASYTNFQELADQVIKQSPWEDTDDNVIDRRYGQDFARPESPQLLYVKPPVSTSSVLRTDEVIRSSPFGQSYIIDDPLDNPSAPLDWYAGQLMIADAVIIHLLGEEHVNRDVHNTKGSVIAGLACGLNRPLLILAHSPYDSPVDYGHLLHVHDTAASCQQTVTEWLRKESDGLPRRRPRRAEKPSPVKWDLRSVSLGQHVAEHERDELDNYFIETGPYYAAQKGPTTILVGRRGTGKTAILYAIKAKLERDRRNHVTMLSPVGYELQGLLRVLRETREFSERGFLIESLWKYLIYSEIASSVEEALGSRAIYQSATDAQNRFLAYCEEQAAVIRPPFSSRLDQAVRSLHDIGKEPSAMAQRARISELLHETLIRDLRRLLGNILSGRGQLAILIDNLDGPWEPGANVPQLTELIRGLLNVVQEIPRDWARATHGLEPVDTRVTVLLRSDIFAFVRPLMPEHDKLPIQRVVWNDTELLRRVLVQRLMQSAPTAMSEVDVWEHVFPEDIMGRSATDFIFDSVLRRPRDVIYMVRAAMTSAINRRNETLTSEDLLNARAQYSNFAFESVLAEDDPQRLKLELLLIEFAGSTKIVSLPKVRECMKRANVTGEDANWYLDLLCDIGFLGITTAEGIHYSAEESERSRLRGIAKRLAVQTGSTETFAINPAFYGALEIA